MYVNNIIIRKVSGYVLGPYVLGRTIFDGPSTIIEILYGLTAEEEREVMLHEKVHAELGPSASEYTVRCETRRRLLAMGLTPIFH